MKVTLAAVLVTLMVGGCDGPNGPEGPQGPAGAVGPAGPRGEAGGLYVVVDANGAEVDSDQSFIWTDDKGWQWKIIPTSATVAAHALLRTEWYASADCSGDAYAEGAYLPRQPIARVIGGYWVRPDSAISSPVFMGSARYDSLPTCSRLTGFTVNAYQLVHVEGLTPPNLPYRAPLRLERRH